MDLVLMVSDLQRGAYDEDAIERAEMAMTQVRNMNRLMDEIETTTNNARLGVLAAALQIETSQPWMKMFIDKY